MHCKGQVEAIFYCYWMQYVTVTRGDMLLDGVGNCALQKASRGPWSAPVRLPDHQGRDCPTEDHQCECHTRQTVTHEKDAHEIKSVFTLHTFSEGEGADPFYRLH